MPAVEDMRAALDRIARERAELEKAWERERAARAREALETQKDWEREQKAREQEFARAWKEWAKTQEQWKTAPDEALPEDTWDRQEAPPVMERFSGGGMVDRVMAGGLAKQFGRLGYRFTKISRNVEFEDPRTGVHLAVDALLENNDCAMAVTIKPALAAGDIPDHIERLRKLRKYSGGRNGSQRFYGALAAAVIDEAVKTSALGQGLYIIDSSGGTVTVTPPLTEPAVF